MIIYISSREFLVNFLFFLTFIDHVCKTVDYHMELLYVLVKATLHFGKGRDRWELNIVYWLGLQV